MCCWYGELLVRMDYLAERERGRERETEEIEPVYAKISSEIREMNLLAGTL